MNGFLQLLLADVLASEQNIFADCAAKQEIILKNNGDIIAQAVYIKVFNIDAVQRYGAGFNIVKPRQQWWNCSFSAAGVAD